MHWSTAPIPYWKKKWVVSTKVNSTVKQMSNGSINAYTRQDVDRKYPSIWGKIQKWIVPLFQTTFHYDAHQWKNCDEFNLLGGETGFDEQESNLSTFWNTSFSKICLGMKINQQLKLIVIYKLADSLHSLIADGQYRKTFLGRDGWKKLIGSNASLQHNCNKEGFNAFSGRSDRSKVRIGIISNDQNDCKSCNSLIGFGTRSPPKGAKSCGNEAYHDGLDNGRKSIKAMEYILVQWNAI